MTPQSGCRAKRGTPGNARLTRLFEQPFMHRPVGVLHPLFDKKPNVHRLHDHPRSSLNVHTPSAVIASEPNRCAEAVVSAQPS